MLQEIAEISCIRNMFQLLFWLYPSASSYIANRRRDGDSLNGWHYLS